MCVDPVPGHSSCSSHNYQEIFDKLKSQRNHDRLSLPSVIVTFGLDQTNTRLNLLEECHSDLDDLLAKYYDDQQSITPLLRTMQKEMKKLEDEINIVHAHLETLQHELSLGASILLPIEEKTNRQLLIDLQTITRLSDSTTDELSISISNVVQFEVEKAKQDIHLELCIRISMIQSKIMSTETRMNRLRRKKHESTDDCRKRIDKLLSIRNKLELERNEINSVLTIIPQFTSKLPLSSSSSTSSSPIYLSFVPQSIINTIELPRIVDSGRINGLLQSLDDNISENKLVRTNENNENIGQILEEKSQLLQAIPIFEDLQFILHTISILNELSFLDTVSIKYCKSLSINTALSPTSSSISSSTSSTMATSTVASYDNVCKTSATPRKLWNKPTFRKNRHHFMTRLQMGYRPWSELTSIANILAKSSVYLHNNDDDDDDDDNKVTNSKLELLSSSSSSSSTSLPILVESKKKDNFSTLPAYSKNIKKHVDAVITQVKHEIESSVVKVLTIKTDSHSHSMCLLSTIDLISIAKKVLVHFQKSCERTTVPKMDVHDVNGTVIDDEADDKRSSVFEKQLVKSLLDKQTKLHRDIEFMFMNEQESPKSFHLDLKEEQIQNLVALHQPELYNRLRFWTLRDDEYKECYQRILSRSNNDDDDNNDDGYVEETTKIPQLRYKRKQKEQEERETMLSNKREKFTSLK